jgi:hypothetical protein
MTVMAACGIAPAGGQTLPAPAAAAVVGGYAVICHLVRAVPKVPRVLWLMWNRSWLSSPSPHRVLLLGSRAVLRQPHPQQQQHQQLLPRWQLGSRAAAAGGRWVGCLAT